MSALTFDFTYSPLIAGHEACDIECQANVEFDSLSDFEVGGITVRAWNVEQRKHFYISLPDDFVFAAAIKRAAGHKAPEAIQEYITSPDGIFGAALERAQMAADRRAEAAE